MKFTASVKDLKTAVDTVSKCIASKPLMPILAGIKLEYDGELIVTGFNLAEGLQVICEVTEEPGDAGSIVILEKDLSALMGKVSGNITCEVSDLTAKFTTEYSTIELQGLDPTEFPELAFHLGKSIGCKLPAKSLTEAIAKCSISASADDNKQLIQGINFKTVDGFLKLASTDGHRLTVCSIPCNDEIESSTISSKFLTKLPKTIAETINLSIGEGQSLFVDESGNSSICRLFEGIYPQYELLLPSSFSRTLTVDRAQLIELLSVAEIAAPGTNLVELKLKASELSIHSNRDSAKAISTMPCELKGNIINLGFNLKYLIQGLKIFDDSEVTLNFNGATEPVVITSLDGMTTHLMMPVQITK